MLDNVEIDVVKKGFNWLSDQQLNSVKELSSTVSAHAVWKRADPYLTPLILKKENGAWNSSIRDTSRACSALSSEGIIFLAAEKWLLARKINGSWNEDVYDTAYALGALADMGTQDREGCQWLYKHYCPAWTQVGTTSLIIMALKKQEVQSENEDQCLKLFIRERAEWILSRRQQDGGWEHISTSNLAIQALIFAGFKKEVKNSVRWLFENVHKSGAWGNKEDDINATALSLITLGLYEFGNL